MKNLKVLIVDDEEFARKMLLESVPWQTLNMTVIGEAISGQDALAIIEEQIPDIVFTDIKMPYMDGIELSQIITKQYPNIKIVILTAFKDFEYARQSVSIGVTHFLLKPINRDELLKTILKLRETIEDEQKQWLEFEHLKKILNENYSFLRERFLLEFCKNSTMTLSSQKQLTYYYPQGLPSYIQIALLTTHSPQYSELSEEKRILQDMKNSEFLKNHFKEDSSIEVITDNNNHFSILLSYSKDTYLIRICEQLQYLIHQSSGYDIIFGIGNAYEDFYQLATSYYEAVDALKYSQLTTNSTISIYQNTLNVTNTTWHLPNDKLDDVRFYVKAGLPDYVKNGIPPLYANMDFSGMISLENARILSMALLSTAINVSNEIGIPLNELLSEDSQSFISILLETDSRNMMELTCSFLSNLAANIASYRTTKNKSALWDIIQYIQQELENPSLSLSSVADNFHMNDSYLSRVFKKELGFSFSKYLIRLRMERAIQLLDTTDMKAYQIAEAVGIPDAYYFSNCFKKYTGVSIRDYKKGIPN